ncbi:MAG: S8 family peptidase [Clostridiales bacterium]|nr:S8 family peptidase [Clostridiales bacterium]
MLSCSQAPVSEDYADFIINYSPRPIRELYETEEDGCVSLINQDYAIVHRPLSQAEPLSLSRYPYASIPKLYGLLDTTALDESGISQVVLSPSGSNSGRGVLLGLIDTGIDYTNPLFRYAHGSSRILAIWDQTAKRQDSPPAVSSAYHDRETLSAEQSAADRLPAYGVVYTGRQINEALVSDDPFQIVPSTDADGHGTFLAGVAAGNRLYSPILYSGAAPDCTLAVVRLKPAKQYLRDFFLIPPGAAAYQENDIMSAVSWLLTVASLHAMPLVICLGIGTGQGNHDGTSPLCMQLQSLAGSTGLAVVAAAGNETGYHLHYLGSPAQDQEYDDAELRVGEQESGFCMEIWARESELYSVSLLSPTGQSVGPIPAISGNETVIPFRRDGARVSISYQLSEGTSGSQLIFLRFESPSAGIWHIRVHPELSLSGQFHIWLPLHQFVTEDTGFLRPAPNTTITDPGNGAMPLTVSTYDHARGSIWIRSSRGYTRSMRVKPDLAAPGVEVQGPAISSGPGMQSVTDNPVFTRRTGSSVAAAIAAGAAADLLSWAITEGNAPYMTDAAVKSMLIRGAGRSQSWRYPNRQWGYGTLRLDVSL